MRVRAKPEFWSHKAFAGQRSHGTGAINCPLCLQAELTETP